MIRFIITFFSIVFYATQAQATTGLGSLAGLQSAIVFIIACAGLVPLTCLVIDYCRIRKTGRFSKVSFFWIIPDIIYILISLFFIFVLGIDRSSIILGCVIGVNLIGLFMYLQQIQPRKQQIESNNNPITIEDHLDNIEDDKKSIIVPILGWYFIAHNTYNILLLVSTAWVVLSHSAVNPIKAYTSIYIGISLSISYIICGIGLLGYQNRVRKPLFILITLWMIMMLINLFIFTPIEFVTAERVVPFIMMAAINIWIIYYLTRKNIKAQFK